jgi:hypothetical protein
MLYSVSGNIRVSGAGWKDRKYPTMLIQEGFEDTPCAALRLIIYDSRIKA